MPVLLFLALIAAACDQGVERTTVNAQSAPVPANVSAGQPAARTQAVGLEFDLPEEFTQKAQDGTPLVTGFRLGFFRGDDATPLHTVEVARSAVKINGDKGIIGVPSQPVPDGLPGLVLRLQTLSAAGASPWSDPSPLVTVPTPRSNTRATRQRRTLEPADLEAHKELRTALQEVLPADARLEDVLTSFRRVSDLALAVAVSREADISFTALVEAMDGPPRRSLRNAVAKVRPDLNAGEVVRGARPAGRQLAGARPPSPR